MELLFEDEQREKWINAIRGGGHAGATPAKSEDGQRASVGSSREANDEALLGRLLDAASSGRPFRPADIARLSDESLLEWFAVCPPAKVTTLAMRHVVGRLGEAAFDRAVEDVDALLPNTSLLEPITPYVSPKVAVLIAKGFAGTAALPLKLEALREKPFAPSPIELWLERHARVATLGLIPVALGDNVQAARAAQLCLMYLAARGRGAELADAAASFGSGVLAALELGPYESLAPLALAGHGLDWIPELLLHEHLDSIVALLTDVDAQEAVPFVATLLDGKKEHQTFAGHWMVDHEGTVRQALDRIPLSLSSRVLRIIDGVETAADQDRLQDFPSMIPAAPEFWTPASWPAILLADGSPLPPPAVENLGQMLRFSPFSRPYIGISHVRASCDAVSLDKFMTRLLDAWSESGESEAHAWVLSAAAWLGSDDCAFQIARRVKSWAHAARGRDLDSAGQVAKRKVSLGLDALSLMPVAAAIEHLHHFAEESPQHYVRKEAEEHLDKIPVERKLVRHRLSTGKTPDVGLDARGHLELDFGPRKFSVELDANLSPAIFELGAERKQLSSFPRPRKDDDPERVANAKARYQRLKAELTSVVAPQISRLEKAMCAKTAWDPDEIRAFLSEPLTGLIARRVLWCVAGERPNGYFRVDERGQLVDLDEELITPTGEIMIPHPVEMGDETVEAWRQNFTKYEIIQPFEQLARRTFAAGPSEKKLDQLPGARGEVPAGRFFELGRRGWVPTMDHGVMTKYTAWLADGNSAELTLSPGISPEHPVEPNMQNIEEVKVSVALGKLSPIAYSELARDLAYLSGPSEP